MTERLGFKVCNRLQKKQVLIVAFYFICHFSFAQNAILSWAKNLGSGSADIGNSIAVDNAGNVYTTGYFSGTADFDPGSGSYPLVSAGDNDIYISKLDVDGNFVWAKQFGGSGQDRSFSIALDAGGNIYTTGYFVNKVDFDPGSDTINLTAWGNHDIFISKITPDGNFVWVKQIGGTNVDECLDMAIDSNGNILFTGHFSGSADFDPGVGVFNMTVSASTGFVAKLDNLGNFFWAKKLGATRLYGITTDASGNVYTTGYFFGNKDFDPGPGTFLLTTSGDNDAVISKLDGSGNFVWARKLGGTDSDVGQSITVDQGGNVYTTGKFKTNADFDPGIEIYNMTSDGDYDVFVSKLDISGNFVWAKKWGGSDLDEGLDIALDASGHVYTTGYFHEMIDFNPGAGTSFLTASGGVYRDVYMSNLDSDGNFIWAGNFGGDSNDEGHSIAVAASGHVHATGHFWGTADFDPGTGTNSLVSFGVTDAFVLKLSPGLTGIRETFGQPLVTVFPNPVFSNLHLFLEEESSVTIFDALGKCVHHTNTIAGRNTIVLHSFAPGIYLLETRKGSKARFIKD